MVATLRWAGYVLVGAACVVAAVCILLALGWLVKGLFRWQLFGFPLVAFVIWCGAAVMFGLVGREIVDTWRRR